MLMTFSDHALPCTGLLATPIIVPLLIIKKMVAVTLFTPLVSVTSSHDIRHH